MTAQGMSVREVLALPASVPLDDANRALNIGRSAGYALVKTGQYPCRVLRLGRAYRVTRASLLEYLGIAQPEPVQLRAVLPEPAPSVEHQQLRSV